MNTIKINITGFGRCLPGYTVHNDKLSEYVDTSHEWIHQRTGITQRRISTKENENTSGLCTEAAHRILANANVSPEEIDLIIVATISPDFLTPSVACMVQANIGAKNAFAFDVSAACSGFIYGLHTAENFLRTGKYKKALVIGGDVLSKIIDWEDRKTCVLFGDGAAGVLLEAGASEYESLCYTDIHSDGTKAESLKAYHMTLNSPFQEEVFEKDAQGVLMDGRGIFDFAIRNVPKSIHKVLDETNVSIEEVKYIIPHQANYRIAEAIAKKLKVPMDKFYMNIDKYGNTTAATIPIALSEMAEQGLIVLGRKDKIIIAGFGGGLTWATSLIEI